MSVVWSGVSGRCGSRPFRRHNPKSVELHDWRIKPGRFCLPTRPPARLPFGPDPKMNSNLFGWLAPIAASSPTSHRDHFPDWSLLCLMQAAEQSGANRCAPEEGRGLISAVFVVAWDVLVSNFAQSRPNECFFYTCTRHKGNCIGLAVIILLLKCGPHDCSDAQGAKWSSGQMEGR